MTAAHCCDAFAEKIKQAVFEKEETAYHINGCCGGHCFVAYDLRYCPYCGSDFQGPKGNLDG